MFSFAALVVHSLFRTNHTPGKGHINMTSSYLDLAPLYGNDQSTQDKVGGSVNVEFRVSDDINTG
jgi:linoleate 10R-lipoxygenase